MLTGPSQNTRSKQRYRSKTSPENSEPPTGEQLNVWSARNAPSSSSTTTTTTNNNNNNNNNNDDLLDFLSDVGSPVSQNSTKSLGTPVTYHNNNNNNNGSGGDGDLLNLFNITNTSAPSTTTATNTTTTKTNTNNNNNNNINSSGHTKTATFDNFDDAFGSNNTNNPFNFPDSNTNTNTNTNTNSKSVSTPTSTSVGDTKKTSTPQQQQQQQKQKQQQSSLASPVSSSSSPGNNKNTKSAEHKEEEKEMKESQSPRSPEAPKTKAPSPPTMDIKSIDVLPLLHKGIRMSKFKMSGNATNVRLFFISSDNKYFCWSPNLDNKNTFDMANLIKSTDDRRILLESVKEVKRNSQSIVQHLRFIPQDRKTLTLTITYNANHKPRENQKGRTRAFTQGGSGLRAPAYKQVCIMAYEPFHLEMVLTGLEKLIAISKDPKEELEQIFELYVDFPKTILPKHLRPQKYKWEALKSGDAEANNSSGNPEDPNAVTAGDEADIEPKID